MGHGTEPLEIGLALEGGGALGAFTWGVLDRLLEDDRLRITAVSGTSAGAMNGAMLVQGLAGSGPEGARALLASFWERVAMASGTMPSTGSSWLQALPVGFGPLMAALQAGSALSNSLAFGSNPLRSILLELLRPELIAAPGAPELVVAATRVRTGEARLFRNADISVDVLLASACLPTLFPAVEIEGESYWDGGYSSNPPVRALVERGRPTDIIIVRTLPSERQQVPSGASAVKDRLAEITFGTPLRSELRSLAMAKASLRTMVFLPDHLARLRDARLHMIAPALGEADALSASMAPTWPFLEKQRLRGHAAAELWLATHFETLGRRSTLDLSHYADGGEEPSRSFWKRAAHAT